MKYLIVLALAAVAYATNPLVPLDTPEVAAAKAVHAVEWNRAASAAAGYNPWDYSAYNHWGAYPYSSWNAYPYSSWAGAVVHPNGYLADTPEVAAAKAAHFAEHAKAGGYVAPYAWPYQYSAYPWAAPVVTPSGFLADTPEVAAAKVAHFAEVAKARAQA